MVVREWCWSRIPVFMAARGWIRSPSPSPSPSPNPNHNPNPSPDPKGFPYRCDSFSSVRAAFRNRHACKYRNRILVSCLIGLASQGVRVARIRRSWDRFQETCVFENRTCLTLTLKFMLQTFLLTLTLTLHLLPGGQGGGATPLLYHPYCITLTA